MKKIQLSDKFTYGKLIRFTLPSVLMMIFTSIYGVVDGFFVSNFAGEVSFAAVNLIMPFLMILGAFGFMFGTGGSALIAKTLGEGDPRRANRIFSLVVYVSVALGVLIALLGIIFIRPVSVLLGAEDGQMLEDCVIYGRIILAALPMYMLQYEFQAFFVTAERPGLGLITTLAAGCANMLLDGIFVGIFGWGIVGAAVATNVSAAVGGIIPLVYFFLPNRSLLRLGGTCFDGKALIRTVTNGSSELFSNISMSVVGMLYNFQLMRLEGAGGVAAYGVLMYVNMIFLAIFIGYSVGTAPIIGYNYGAGNKDELRSLLKKSVVIIGFSSVAMVVLAELLAYPLSLLFVGYSEPLVELTVRGFRLFSFSFLFAGLAIYGSSFFTALNNGLISALISFLRTMIFQVAAVIVLPILFGTDGIWVSVLVAELMAALLTVMFILIFGRKYGYLGRGDNNEKTI